MDTSRRENENSEASQEMSSPILSPMSPTSFGALFTCVVVGILAAGWCLLDHWNRQITKDLFEIGDMKTVDINQDGLPEVVSPFKQFSYPLTLAFLQFVFMGVFFTVLHFSINQERPADLRRLNLIKDKRWPSLVVTHVFSTFWLQTLMLPAQVFSLGVFAASRATEIPVAAALRGQVLGPRYYKRITPTALAFSACLIMFFAYAQLAGCVCVWSGNGVALSGLAFWIIYLMLLAMPAANAVCQEAIMSSPGMHPILLLALQNIFACLLFGPILMLCHLIGWEDVGAAFEMILTYSEVFMMVVWLCAQMAATSVLCITLIHVVDSFWTIALRALRVVFWSMGMLGTYYFSSHGIPLSIGCPHSSAWMFVLLCSVMLGGAAICSDRAPSSEEPEKGGAMPLPGKSASSQP